MGAEKSRRRRGVDPQGKELEGMGPYPVILTALRGWRQRYRKKNTILS